MTVMVEVLVRVRKMVVVDSSALAGALPSPLSDPSSGAGPLVGAGLGDALAFSSVDGRIRICFVLSVVCQASLPESTCAF